MSAPLSFAPDRRSLQTTNYFHFSDTSKARGYHALSRIDSLKYALEKEYQQQNWADMVSAEMRTDLINKLVSYVPLEHKNLAIMAAANILTYNMLFYGLRLTPEYFEAFWRRVQMALGLKFNNKNQEENQTRYYKYKTTLYRYVLFILLHMSEKQ